MFGFGMSALDRAIIAKTEEMLAPIGLTGQELEATAKQLFEEVKADLKRRNPDRVYSETTGDEFLRHPAFMANRRPAGLTEDDIRAHWNRCLLLVFIEAKDAPIYAEFAPRVEAWIRKTDPSHRAAVLANYTTFNAMVRDLAKKGDL